MSKKIVLITGASSGFGALTARALADADGGAANIVYAGMRDTNGRNAPQVQGANDYAAEHGVDLRAIELDANSEESVDAAVKQILDEHGRIDVLTHNAGHMVVGPAEVFTPEQRLGPHRQHRRPGPLQLARDRARRRAGQLCGHHPRPRQRLQRHRPDGFPAARRPRGEPADRLITSHKPLARVSDPSR